MGEMYRENTNVSRENMSDINVRVLREVKSSSKVGKK